MDLKKSVFITGPISNAAILQLAATVPNFLIHEIMLTDGSFRKRVTNEKVVFEDGFIKINDCVGLGIEINEDVIEEYPYKTRNLRHYNNALTNIRPLDDNNYYFECIMKNAMEFTRICKE